MGSWNEVRENCVEHVVAARLAEHDERARMRRASKATRGAQWQAIKASRGRASEERARLRGLRNKPCGARTRTGHPCQRKGLGKGGRCPNHGGLSTGPKTPEGRARLSALLKARWALLRASALPDAKSKVEKNTNASSRVVARSPTAKQAEDKAWIRFAPVTRVGCGKVAGRLHGIDGRVGP